MTGDNTVRAVIFDFGKVICNFDVAIFLRNIAPYTPRTFQELRNTLKDSMDLAVAFETGTISPHDFYKGISERAALSMPEEKFIEAYCNIFTPIPTTVELIKRLKPSYTLGLLSNTSAWHFEYGIKPVEVFALFDAVTLSYEVKAMKPAEAIYKDMLRKLGLPAASCAYIDDIPENVQAGREIGMRAIVYTGYEALAKSLTDEGVNIP